MQLTNQQLLPVSQAIAWDALNDVTMLKESIPGCDSLTASGEGQYDMTMTAAIGPVKAKFKGKLTLSDLKPTESYNLAFEGQGGAAGHGKGTASVRLEPTGENTTTLHYTANAQVGGKIAQIGSRLIDMAAQKMATEFFSKFNAALEAKYPPPLEESVEAPPPPEEPHSAGGRAMAKIKGLFGQ
jgi:uncharacterized protein